MRLRFYVKEAIMSRTLTIKSKTKKEEQNLTILYARLSKMMESLVIVIQL